MRTTSIQWTEATWNPVRGCSVVSPGCVHCYAMKQAHRFSGPGKPYHGLTKPTKAGPQWTGVVRCIEDALDYPLTLRKPHLIFVNSMSDLFHEDVPDAFIDRVFAVMALAPRHTFQILTKRAERMRDYMARACGRIADAIQPLRTDNQRVLVPLPHVSPGSAWWPLPNVWLGASVEDQARADERIPRLLQTPAAVRWISAEPLLGPVDLQRYLRWKRWNFDTYAAPDCRLDWVVVGGESGKDARPFDLAWARSIVQQCQASGVPVFVKQLGASPSDPDHIDEQLGYVGLRDRKGGNPREWPIDLRIRQHPEARG